MRLKSFLRTELVLLNALTQAHSISVLSVELVTVLLHLTGLNYHLDQNKPPMPLLVCAH